jgi:hypothetical protein
MTVSKLRSIDREVGAGDDLAFIELAYLIDELLV